MTKAFRHIIATALTALLFVASQANAQEEDWIRWCGGDFDLCGYYDRETNAEIIPPIYDRALPFSEGLAAVRYQGQYGYINPQGEMVIAPQFDLAGEFRFGMAEVLLGDLVGTIDRTGAFKIEPQYARAIPISRNAVLIEQGTWRGIYHHGGLPFRYDGYGIRRADGIRVSSTFWPVGVGSRLRFEIFDPNGQRLIWAGLQLRHSSQLRYGLYSIEVGNWWALPEYTEVYPVSDGMARAVNSDGQTLFLNSEGEVQFVSPYPYTSDFEDGFVQVTQTYEDGSTAYGVLDKTGALIGNRLYSEVREPTSRNRWQVLSDDIWLVVAPDGSLSIAPPLPPETPRLTSPFPRRNVRDPVTTNCANGATIINEPDGSDSNYGMISADGTVLIEPSYDALMCYREGVAWAANFGDGEWCPIGTDGLRAPYPACRTTFNPIGISHHGPEPMDSDFFTSSVKWMQAFLEFECGGSTAVPRLRRDYSQSTVPAVHCN